MIHSNQLYNKKKDKFIKGDLKESPFLFFAFYLIPRPLLPGEKGRKKNLIRFLTPLPWERGWGVRFIHLPQYNPNTYCNIE
jgi:hypothetical protein